MFDYNSCDYNDCGLISLADRQWLSQSFDCLTFGKVNSHWMISEMNYKGFMGSTILCFPNHH